MFDVEAMPKQADVIVVGSGIVGCATAFYLIEQGMKVVIVEKCDSVGQEQSSRNWGFVRQLGRDPKELPLMKRAIGIWEGLERHLGYSLGWQQGGALALTNNESDLASYEEWQRIAQSHDINSEILNRDKVADLIPEMDRKWAGGIFVRNDGNADPDIVTNAFANAFRKRGGVILTGVSVQGFDIQAGTIQGVVTNSGVIKAKNVVVAAGAWTSQILKWIGLTMPQMRLRVSVGRTEPVERKTQIAAWTQSLGFVQRKDNCFTVSALVDADHDASLASFQNARYFLRDLIENRDQISICFGRPFVQDLVERVSSIISTKDRLHAARVPLEPPVNQASVRKSLNELRQTFAGLDTISIQKTWAGYLDVTPDMLPVIEPHSYPAGLVVASGFSGHGFGIAPGVGATIAELLSGVETNMDISEFGLNRFKEGNYGRPYSLL